MQYDPEKHHRRSIRLKGYDYSQAGWYFVTLCTRNYLQLFGKIEDGVMMVNEVGQLVAETLQWLPAQYEYVQLAEWIVMPNHLHAIIVIDDSSGDDDGKGHRGDSRIAPTKRKPLGRLIGAFKTVSTKRINEMRNITGVPVWQRNFYEHIIRDQDGYLKIAEYIQTNPLKWAEDRYYGMDG